MSAHTVGTWKTREESDGSRVVYAELCAEHTGRVVAVTYEPRRMWAFCTADAKANTALILAAPDLLAVVAEFIRDIEAIDIEGLRDEWPDLIVTFRNAQKAIAKARAP